MELSEVTGDVNLDDIDSEVLPRLVMNSNEPNNNDNDNKDHGFTTEKNLMFVNFVKNNLCIASL